MKREILNFFSLVVLFLIGLVACGGAGTPGGAGLNDATAVTGASYSPNGDAMPGVTVYIPGTTVSPMIAKSARTFNKVVTASDGTTCEDPPAADLALASCCSAQDGTFSCDTSAITTDPEQIVFFKGSLRMVQTLSCSSGTCTLDKHHDHLWKWQQHDDMAQGGSGDWMV